MASKSLTYPTQQQKYGVKLQLICEKAEECEREMFHKHFSRDPATLFNQLNEPANRRILNDLKKKRVLKEDQYLLLFPSSGLTDSSKFDMTLLSLLVRSICGYQEPTTGWNKDPDDADESDIADSIRFTLSRNRIKHHPLSTPRDKFKDSYNYLEKALLRRRCTQGELNNIDPSLNYCIRQNPSTLGHIQYKRDHSLVGRLLEERKSSLHL